MQQAQRNYSTIMTEKPISSPQVGIYNRNFYLRGAEHNLKQAEYENEVKQLANKPKISISSYNILCEQLEDRMLDIFGKNCGGNAEGAGFSLENSRVGFLQLQKIVNQVCQIKSTNSQSDMEHFLSQLWLVLGQYQILSEIKANLVYTSLRIFLDPYNLSEAQYLEMLNNIDQFRKSSENRQVFLKQYPELRDETLTVNEVIKLWRKIRYNNPSLARVNPKTKENRRQYAFHPEINKKSEFLAEKSLKKYLETHQSALNRTLDPKKQKKSQNELSRYLDNNDTYQIQNSRYFSKPSFHDILYQRRLQKDEMAIKMPKEESFYSSQASRTAKPEEIRQIVNNLYVVRERRQETDFVKRDEENQLKMCTFSPKINKKYQGSRSSVSPAVKGYEKQVGRVLKGREEKQKKKLAYENLGRVRNFSRNYSKSPNTSRSIAPSFIDRDTPKLILQINIDGERVEKLPLKGNEDPHLVSKKFVIKHGLEQQMIQVLEALVEEQLRNL